mmetsp:Transcript_14423/g.39404  ORF Transcript_14423/g.39404 Transcript_14423/m.39404 type:complete len:228 (-) Transcript_14423:57-740(-)
MLDAETKDIQLSDFLSGISPSQTQREILEVYKKIDPHDETGWMQTISRAKSTQAPEQATRQSKGRIGNLLVKENMSDLLQQRAALLAKIRAQNTKFYSRRTKELSTGTPDQPVLTRLARTADIKANYQNWLRTDATSLKQSVRRPQFRPHISASGMLTWRESDLGSAGRRVARAVVGEGAGRLQSLYARDPPLEEGGSASESWSDIKARADSKVDRWMGAGYYPVFG